MNRRNIILAAVGLVAAPAVLRLGAHMAVRPLSAEELYVGRSGYFEDGLLHSQGGPMEELHSKTGLVTSDLLWAIGVSMVDRGQLPPLLKFVPTPQPWKPITQGPVYVCNDYRGAELRQGFIV